MRLRPDHIAFWLGAYLSYLEEGGTPLWAVQISKSP